MLVGPNNDPGTVRIGRYEVLRKIATGGMAELFIARQVGMEGFEKVVAIKRILSHFAYDKEFIEMLCDEGRLVALLHHPNIVQVYTLDEDRDTYFIAMEYIPGRNLSSVAKKARAKGGRFPPEFVARCVAQACEGLHYAHTRTDEDGCPLGIVHRDVSPQNIILAFSGAVKLVDFGIAKAATKVGHTRAGVLKGKYAYMSPEQIRGEVIDGRSDVFAVGVVLYELLCGRRPFEKDNSIQTLKAIVQEPHVDCRRVHPEIPDALAEIIDHALVKDPRRRFQTAQDVQIALEDFVSTSPVRSNSIAISRWVSDLFAEEIRRDRGGTVLLPGLGEVVLPEVDRDKDPGSDSAPSTPHGETPDLEGRWAAGRSPLGSARVPIQAPSTLSRPAFGREMGGLGVNGMPAKGYWDDATVQNDDPEGGPGPLPQVSSRAPSYTADERHYPSVVGSDRSGPTASLSAKPLSVQAPTVDMELQEKEPWNEATVGDPGHSSLAHPGPISKSGAAEPAPRVPAFAPSTMRGRASTPSARDEVLKDAPLEPKAVGADDEGRCATTDAREPSEDVETGDWRDLTDFDGRHPFDHDGETWSLDPEAGAPVGAIVAEPRLLTPAHAPLLLDSLGPIALVTGQHPLNAEDFSADPSETPSGTAREEPGGHIGEGRGLPSSTVASLASFVGARAAPSDWGVEIELDAPSEGVSAMGGFFEPPTESTIMALPSGGEPALPDRAVGRFAGGEDAEGPRALRQDAAAREPPEIHARIPPQRGKEGPVTALGDPDPNEPTREDVRHRRPSIESRRSGPTDARAQALWSPVPLVVADSLGLAPDPASPTSVAGELELSNRARERPLGTAIEFGREESTRGEGRREPDGRPLSEDVKADSGLGEGLRRPMGVRQIREVVREGARESFSPTGAVAPAELDQIPGWAASAAPPGSLLAPGPSARPPAPRRFGVLRRSVVSAWRPAALVGMSVFLGATLIAGLIALAFPELLARRAPTARISTTPEGAIVYVDGRQQRSLTPVELTGLRAGTHYDLRVELEGHEVVEQALVVPEDQSSILVTIPMRARTPSRPELPLEDATMVAPDTP